MKSTRGKITDGYNDFRFNFDYVDDTTDDSFSIDDTDVVEYEFINQGTSIVVINDGLRLYPQFAGIAPVSWKGSVNDFENDTTTYKFKFEPLDYVALQATATPPGLPPNVNNIILSALSPAGVLSIGGEMLTAFNRLLVITKVKTQLRGNPVKSPNPKYRNR